MTKNVFWMDVGQYFPLNMVNDVLNPKIFIIWVMQIILNFFLICLWLLFHHNVKNLISTSWFKTDQVVKFDLFSRNFYFEPSISEKWSDQVWKI